MILKKTAFLCFAILLSIFVLGQQTLTRDQQQVQEAVVKMFEALSNRDSVSLKAYCTADITLYEYGHIWNMDTLIHNVITLNTAADFKRSNTFDFIHTETDKNTAWVTYRLRLVITLVSKEIIAEWLETIVLAKQRNQWKVKHLHSTLLNKS